MDSWKKATGIGPTASIPKGTGAAKIGAPQPHRIGERKFDRVVNTEASREKLKRFLPDAMVDFLIPAVKPEDFVVDDMTASDFTDVGGTAGAIKSIQRVPKLVGFKGVAPQVKADILDYLKRFPRLASTVKNVEMVAPGQHTWKMHEEGTIGSARGVVGGNPQITRTKMKDPNWRPDAKTQYTDITLRNTGKPDEIKETFIHELTHAAQNAFRGGKRPSPEALGNYIAHDDLQKFKQDPAGSREIPYPIRPNEIAARAVATGRMSGDTMKKILGTDRTMKVNYKTSLEEAARGEPGYGYQPQELSNAVDIADRYRYEPFAQTQAHRDYQNFVEWPPEVLNTDVTTVLKNMRDAAAKIEANKKARLALPPLEGDPWGFNR